MSDLKKIGDLCNWKKTADYILDRKGGGDRVEAIRVTNCANEEPGLALAEIAKTQERNTSSKTDKTYHLFVSFPPGEKPTPTQLHDIEDKLCEAIGLADLLFDRDGETLVKPATAAQVARASILRIGDALAVDARGRMHEQQEQQIAPTEREH